VALKPRWWAAAVVRIDRRSASGPCEHGWQAARSKRSRTGRAAEETTQASHASAAVGGALIH